MGSRPDHRQPVTRCAIYIRKSREEAGKPSHRLTVQRQQLPDHARAQGWTVEVYDDGHASAARGKAEDLRQRARLEQDIRAGRVQVVLCIELSRLSRDDSLQDYVAWLHLCSEHRVKLATPSRTLDPAQHSDWMLLLMEGGFSSVEMRVLQARMREGRAEAYRAGKYLSGNPPIPYRYDQGAGGLVIDPEQLPRFQRLMQLAETLPAKEVARRTGVPHITVRRAIADDRLLFYQGLRIDPANGETLPGQWPPVLDADQADRIRAGRIHKVSGYQRRHHGSLLSNLGLLICGYCGRSVRASQGGRRKRDGSRQQYYGCKAKEGRDCDSSRMHQQAHIDERLTTNLLGTLGRLDDLHRAWQSQQSPQICADQLADLEREAATLRAKKQRLVAAIAEGIIDFADARPQSQTIDQALAELSARRTDLQHRQSPPPDFTALAQIADRWPELDQSDQRALIAAAIEQIQLHATYLTITYRFPRDTTGNRTSRVHLPGPEKPGRKPGKK